MAKRRRQTPDSDSEDEDASYAPAPKARKRTTPSTSSSRSTRASAGGRKDTGRPSVSTGAADLAETETGPEQPAGPPHPSALHRIADAAALRGPLLGWYAGVRDRRGMPWRKPFDPALDADGRAQRAYEVWISEVMLQQTQVATVIPYYDRWMQKFPTLRHLAGADIAAVHALWKGLGYYSRAGRLLEGAKKAVRDLGGRLPDNAKDMEAQMPGIGRYSAGAICSIAYNQCVPVLDGNVHRLLSRVLALHAPPKAKATLDVLWAGAAALVAGSDRAGDVNQALIELGSTVCRVREPACGACPLAARCQAYADAEDVDENVNVPSSSSPAGATAGQGVPDVEDLCTLCAPLGVAAGRLVTAYPMKAARKKARAELDVVSVVEWRRAPGAGRRDRWFLLVRRPEGGLLGGLHEFPTAADQPQAAQTASAMHATAHRQLAALLAQPPGACDRAAGAHGCRAGASPASEPGGPLRIAHTQQAGDVVHVFSHIRKTYRVQWVVLHGGRGPPPLAVARGKAAAALPLELSRDAASPPEEAAPLPAEARWVRLPDVAHATVGTGVLKVWKKVASLWGGGGDGDDVRGAQ